MVIEGGMADAVRERLRRKHSPEQISGALCRENVKWPSRTSIYNYIEADKDGGGNGSSLFGVGQQAVGMRSLAAVK